VNLRCEEPPDLPANSTGRVHQHGRANVLTDAKDAESGESSVQTSHFLEREDVRARFSVIDKAVDSFIVTERGEPAVLYDAAQHLLKAGGKRVRSLLVILSCEGVGGNIEDAMPFALTIELLQTASLIHDDIIDEDLIRRGVQTTHELFGNKIAVIAGDLLIGLALRMIGKMATPELLTRLGEGGIKMCEGEVADFLMAPERADCLTVANYLSVIGNKTAAFMREAAAIGAMLGKGTESQQEALGKYGEKLGYAFQIRDDVLDVRSTTHLTGKSVLSDLRNGRCSYPLVYALENSSARDKSACLAALRKHDFRPALKLISKSGALERAVDLAKGYVVEAKQAVSTQELANRSLLEGLADFVVERIY